MKLEEKFNLESLSQELLCHILSYLPLKQVLLIGTLNKNLLTAVELHLRLVKVLDFCESDIIGWMSLSITDKHLLDLLKKCPNVEIINGLHPVKIDRWRLRKSNSLSVIGIVDALSLCPRLKKVETSNFRLLEAFAQHLPQLQIAGHFRNRDGVFPPQPNQQIKLSPFLRLTSLHLIGLQVPELPAMQELEHLHLQWVLFTRLHPFRSFSAMKLKTFVMKHCIGPSVPLRHYPLFIALGFAPELTRLEIVRVPILSGMIHRSVEEALRNNGFKKIKKLVVGDCKGVMESDLGQLMIASSQTLETLFVQASLTKDSLFVSLHFARCDFPRMHTLHLGYVDYFPPRGEWSNDTLLNFGLADVPDVPSSITDSGLKTISHLFPNVQNLTITNCHHIVNARDWVPEGNSLWDNLTCLILERCHCLRLPSFTLFISDLEKIEVIVLKNMFREPPKGCSHVGLSAGTGLGLSSAIVSTRDEHIAVQGHHVEAVPENEDDIIPDNELDHAVDEMQDQEHEQNVGRLYRRNSSIQEAQGRVNANVRHCDNFEAGPSCSRNNAPRKKKKYRCKNKSNVPAKGKNLRFSKKHSKVGQAKLKSRCSNSVVKSNQVADISDSSIPSSDSSSSENLSVKKHPKNNRRCYNKEAQASSSKEPNVKAVGRGYTGPVTRNRSRKISGSCSKKYSNQHVSSAPGESSQKKPSASSKCKSTIEKKRRCSNRLAKEHSRRQCNKAPGTSDPFLEEDVTLVFPVTSQSLISLAILSCGISEITIDQCPSLLYVEVQTCRILKLLHFIESHSITKVNISQCPKLNTPHIISEVINIHSTNPILVYMEPYLKNQDYNSTATIETIFHNANANNSIIILHEYGDCDADNVQSRKYLLNMLHLIKSSVNDIYPSILWKNKIKRSTSLEDLCDSYCCEQLDSKSSLSSAVSKYPWGHHIDRIVGKSETGEYELITNNPIFSTVWRENKNCIEDNSLYGSSVSETELPSSIIFDVAELIEYGVTVGSHYIGFYINVDSTCSV